MIEVLPPTPIKGQEYILGNSELPIAKHRAEIETAIRKNSVTILVACTGSGKTTQVPQFAVEMSDYDGESMFEEIIVTQPRIVAARTVSDRVAFEIDSADQTDSVGYYTSNEGSRLPQREQDIVFLTDGKAAAQLLHQGNAANNKKRILIIDEVHEWNVNIEQLIAIATEKTDPNSEQYDENLKVVIMSATMDSSRLKEHFAYVNAPLIEVEVPVHEITRSVSEQHTALVALDLVRPGGKVLAFFPGKTEIKEAAVKIEKVQSGAEKKVSVVPLHGQQNAEEQSKAFDFYPNGAVIATTNAAETSLTVPGATAVADSGEVRTDRVRYDLVSTGSEGLYLEDASQANLLQRMGRVGRIESGHYTSCSPDGKIPPTPFNERPEYGTPAIERTRLDSLVLHLKATGYETGDFRYFHKPLEKAVEAAKTRLFVLGALDKDGSITERGIQMEKLPLDPEYSAMITFTFEKGYNDEVKRHVIDLAAIMQKGGILKRSPNERRWVELLEKDVDDEVLESDSDFFAQLEAYIKLTSDIEQEDWKNYDINEHAAGLVEQSRASLYKKLGVPMLETPSLVEPVNRQSVLTSINTGQLNQLWRRNGDAWRLVLGTSSEYELSRTSVVRELGELATGSLFTLGLRTDSIDSIQNVNSVPSTGSIEQAAKHLIVEVVKQGSITYDAVKQQLFAQVERSLGGIVLSSSQIIVEATPDSPEAEMAKEGYRIYAWGIWNERKARLTAYSLDTIDDAVSNPERTQYGTDPISGDPLYAWRGGKGQWCRSLDVALNSLEAHRSRLIKAPKQIEQRAIKSAVRDARTGLIARKNSFSLSQEDRDAAKRHLSIKSNTQPWLEKARELLGIVELSEDIA